MMRMRWLREPDVSDSLRFLDEIADQLEAGRDVAEAMENLSDGLWWLRRELFGDDWTRFCVVARRHRLAGLVHQDPFTFRSFSKPRGYAGDAGLIDMIYHDLGVADLGEPTALGRAIFDRNKDAPAPAAVRERRDYVTQLIDEVCANVRGAAILSVAGGHARELAASESIRRSEFQRMVVLDQDEHSLEHVRRKYGGLGVETHAAKVSRLLASPDLQGAFDLVYSAGLFDYLQDRFAERLTTALFSLLRPGGRLIIGNFVPGIYDVGYMESYMDWWLTYRDGGQMTGLAASLPASDVSSVRTYSLNHPDVVYLEARRRRRPLVPVVGLPSAATLAGHA